MLKHGILENFTVDSHSGFLFLTKRFQLWSAAQLDIILHRIVYDYNSIEVANAIIEDREPELLTNITAHILRHTACTRMTEAGMVRKRFPEPFPVLHHFVHQNHPEFTPLLHHFTKKIWENNWYSSHSQLSLTPVIIGLLRTFAKILQSSEPYKIVSGWREGERACLGGVVEIEVGNLHRNYTGWEELQYDKM